MNNIYVPCTGPEQWQALLAAPTKHWRKGYSARVLAYSWSEAGAFPAEVDAVLRSSPPFRDIEMLVALPEHQVPLPGGVHPSQNDLWVLARAGEELVSIAVEGKVKEPFDKPVREWMSDHSAGKRKRLEYLAATLGLPVAPLDEIRYQLLHRTASAVIEATRFGAAHAVMLVHSFSQTQEHFEDYRRFVGLYDREARPQALISVGLRSGISLHFAWVTGDPEYLMK